MQHLPLWGRHDLGNAVVACLVRDVCQIGYWIPHILHGRIKHRCRAGDLVHPWLFFLTELRDALALCPAGSRGGGYLKPSRATPGGELELCCPTVAAALPRQALPLYHAPATVQVETMDGGELEGLREADMFEVSDPAEEREIHEARDSR